ncbi:MAG: bifunctional 4-hydroxy-2-oxoglutarate aldolase/2-dehydro-3-deoxy-phosphogluconate aldolase [Clostridia bacterium]|nr:bifunctional 4-hydroxy-2-oxoglutarate aldolase/2-dehydro-3-deoxy-phosphogluconate aldolase [Clostridia bacterium]
MTDLQKILYETAVVPVIKISDPVKAAPLAHALVKGGIRTAEITFRTDAAAESIRRMLDAEPDMIVGAGTVLTLRSLDDAVSAGSAFIVAPGLNPKIVTEAGRKNVPMVPGIMTPTELEAALELGLDFVKFFPAEAAGGVKLLKAMSAPYSMVKFMPTGGVTMANAGEYLSMKSVICCGGSFIADDKLIEGGDFEQITRNAAAVCELAAEYR